MLTVARFFTGLGIGGGFAGAAALTGDYTPHRLRATMIMATFTGAPIGGFLGGQIVALLLPHYGWPMIFIIGGVFPLVLVLALAIWLPESPRFLAAQAEPVAAPRRRAATPRHRAWHWRDGRCRARQSDPDAVRPGLRVCRPCCCGSSISAAC